MTIDTIAARNKRTEARFKSSRLPDRFWEKTEPCPMSGCWHWMAGSNAYGYGVFYWEGRSKLSHRVAYEVLVGPVPEDMCIDHVCRNRGCCNPQHLDVVTSAENTRRGKAGVATGAMNKEKTHCPQGHLYDEQNTYRYPTGGRSCRACQRERNRRSRRETQMNTSVISRLNAKLSSMEQRAEAAEARVAELEWQNIELEEKARVATGQSVALVKRTEAKLARADRLAEEAQECIEERESYWGSQEGMHRHNPEYERLERALSDYRSDSRPNNEGEES